MPNNYLLGNVPVDLLYQALETEKGGVQIYSTALRCAVNKDLKKEWNEYLEQTKTTSRWSPTSCESLVSIRMLRRPAAKSFVI